MTPAPLTKLRAVVGLAGVHLRRDAARTVLVVLGIVLAVLATTLLASVGYGVLATGEEKFEAANRDLWITGGPMQLEPGSVGGFENTIGDAHSTATRIERIKGVNTAVPIAFQTLYVGTTPDNLKTIVGVGVPGTGGSSVQITSGRGFERSDHYAGGSYDGPMSHEVVIDRRTAALFNVSVGDTLYVGGTIVSARHNTVTVVGISPTFSRFLGTPTVTMPLAELQTLTYTAASDRATLITVSVADSTDVTFVEQKIAAMYPTYDVRTNREQLRAILKDKALILAAGGTLVILAVVAGVALTVNLLALLVYQQRNELAAIRALGISAQTLGGLVAAQAILLGIIGGVIGLAVTIPAASLLNAVAAELVGFQGLVRTPDIAFVAGATIAVGIGSLGAIAASWRISRINPLRQLD